jgi:hypothetical protein
LINRSDVASEVEKEDSCMSIPDFDRVIEGGRCKVICVRAKLDLIDQVLMACKP